LVDRVGAAFAHAVRLLLRKGEPAVDRVGKTERTPCQKR
jgi:hypothetical protein